MTEGIERLARPAVRAMAPYASARSLARPGAGTALLDANESPWSGLEEAGAEGLNRYPDPKPAALVAALAVLYGARPERVFVGRGSDEAIDCLVRCFCEAGASSILTLEPSYGLYETAAAVQGARVLRAPLDEAAGFAVDPGRVAAAAAADTRLVFLCSPNNPTGRSIPGAAVRALCRAFEGRALVVLDEAYAEFSEEPSLSAEAGDIPNLAVLRTLSKAWGLAGLRVGAALAGEGVITLLDRVRAPYPLPTPVVRAALAALKDPAAMRSRAARLCRARAGLARELAALPGVARVFPSDANFLLLALEGLSPEAAVARLAASGVLARARGRYLRVSVGGEAETRRLIGAWPVGAEAV